jgi:hypothetical protein
MQPVARQCRTACTEQALELSLCSTTSQVQELDASSALRSGSWGGGGGATLPDLAGSVGSNPLLHLTSGHVCACARVGVLAYLCVCAYFTEGWKVEIHLNCATRAAPLRGTTFCCERQERRDTAGEQW